MTINATALPTTARPDLRLIGGGGEPRSARWYERRAHLRTLVGGCPDHWWNPTTRRTAACTCDRYPR